MTDEARRRAGPSLASFNAIKACHMAHFYEDGLCAECVDSFAAAAVEEMVGLWQRIRELQAQLNDPRVGGGA